MKISIRFMSVEDRDEFIVAQRMTITETTPDGGTSRVEGNGWDLRSPINERRELNGSYIPQ